MAKRKTQTKPEEKPTEQRIARGIPVSLLDGKAKATFTSRAIDGRYRGWICNPNGTRVEQIIVAGLEEAEARAAALKAKGAL